MLSSLAEMANPKANSQELPARITAADTGWVWATGTSQGNPGYGDVQLPRPLPHSSDGKSPAQPDGCTSPSPRSPGQGAALLPGLSPLALIARQFSLHFYPKSTLMHFKPISSVLSGAALESRILPFLLWQLPPGWGGRGDFTCSRREGP